MILNKLIKNSSFALLGIIVWSCGPDQVGPNLKGASDDFDKNVDFHFYQDDDEDPNMKFNLHETSYFGTNTFNEEVSWTVTVTGYGSGSEAKISGLSDKLSQDNAEWLYGRSSNVYFFQRNEYVKCELKIVGLDTTYVVDSLKFQGEYRWTNKTINGVRHFVVDEFDSDDPIPTQGLSATSPDQVDNDVVIAVTDANKVEGSNSLAMSGEDVNSNGWIGSRNHDRLLELAACTDLSKMPIDSTTSPDDLYFNIFIYGDSDYPGTTVELKIYENEDFDSLPYVDDLRNYALDELNTLNSAQKAISDAWLYDIIVNWDGWKMVSVPYSAFRATNNPLTGGNGNRIKEPGRISGIEASLLSFPTAGLEVKTYIDFLTFTQGGRPQFKLQ
tara:strand:+ start:265 stop:1422 length:1158 start_codon:yes stop_codon:yes gene_type:complete